MSDWVRASLFLIKPAHAPAHSLTYPLPLLFTTVTSATTWGWAGEAPWREKQYLVPWLLVDEPWPSHPETSNNQLQSRNSFIMKVGLSLATERGARARRKMSFLFSFFLVDESNKPSFYSFRPVLGRFWLIYISYFWRTCLFMWFFLLPFPDWLKLANHISLETRLLRCDGYCGTRNTSSMSPWGGAVGMALFLAQKAGQFWVFQMLFASQQEPGRREDITLTLSGRRRAGKKFVYNKRLGGLRTQKWDEFLREARWLGCDTLRPHRTGSGAREAAATRVPL